MVSDGVIPDLEVGVVAVADNLDVFQVVLAQRFLGQTLLNVFFYQMRELTGVVNAATQLAQGFQALFSTDASGTAFDSVAFSDDLLIDSISVRNLFDDSEIAGILLGGLAQGANNTVNDSPFLAYRLTQVRSRGDMRNGQKYFGGMCVSATVSGVLNATVQAALVSLETACSSVIVFDDTPDHAEFVPIIVKRIFVEATEDTPAHYRLPESLSELTSYDATSWVTQDNMSTRNTRKFGRGI